MSLDAVALESLVKRYLGTVATGTAADIAAMYAEDATVEDPVGGGEVHIGRQAIAGFYKNMEGVDLKTELISTMTFDSEGKIASMKAYWGQDNVTTTY